MQMKSCLRKVTEDIVAGKSCPADFLDSIYEGVPNRIVNETWSSVILDLFMEKGDTAYNRDGYASAVNLIEKHLIRK